MVLKDIQTDHNDNFILHQHHHSTCLSIFYLLFNYLFLIIFNICHSRCCKCSEVYTLYVGAHSKFSPRPTGK